MSLKAATQTDRCLADFEGRWTLRKAIQHADGKVARFEGSADFTPVEEGLDYLETGTLFLNGNRLEARQRYLWRAGLAVHFADGRYFHTVPANGGEAAHYCAPDQYDVVYDFRSWPEWRSTWRVEGPRKRYEMVCIYAR